MSHILALPIPAELWVIRGNVNGQLCYVMDMLFGDKESCEKFCDAGEDIILNGETIQNPKSIQIEIREIK